MEDARYIKVASARRKCYHCDVRLPVGRHAVAGHINGLRRYICIRCSEVSPYLTRGIADRVVREVITNNPNMH